VTVGALQIFMVITFRVSRIRREMYIGHARLCLCLSVPGRILTLLHGPGCNLGIGRGCPLVVHYWADLRSVHGFHRYDNIAPNAKCQRVLVLAHYLAVIVIIHHSVTFLLPTCFTNPSQTSHYGLFSFLRTDFTD